MIIVPSCTNTLFAHTHVCPLLRNLAASWTQMGQLGSINHIKMQNSASHHQDLSSSTLWIQAKQNWNEPDSAFLKLKRDSVSYYDGSCWLLSVLLWCDSFSFLVRRDKCQAMPYCVRYELSRGPSTFNSLSAMYPPCLKGKEKRGSAFVWCSSVDMDISIRCRPMALHIDSSMLEYQDLVPFIICF